MTDKVQKIREEVEKLKLCTMDEHMKFYSEAAEAEYSALCKVEKTIDSLQEEPVSEEEELEETAKNHAAERYKATRDMVLAEKCKWSFKEGAEWQKKHNKL